MSSRRPRWRTTRPRAPRGRLDSACGLDRIGSFGDSAVRDGARGARVPDARLPVALQKRGDEFRGIEYAEILALFTDAHEADRNLQPLRDGQHHTAFGGA